MKTQKFIKMLTIAGLVVGLGAPLAWAQESRTEQRGQLTAKDYKFLSQISQGGTSEVELGQLAKKNGGSQAVRDFGDRMVTDHTKMNSDISQLAASKQVTLPGEVSHRDRSTAERLEKLTAIDFDKAYLTDMVKDHRKDVKEFEAAAKDLSDPDLRAFAQKALPTIQQHLRLAEDMLAQIKK